MSSQMGSMGSQPMRGNEQVSGWMGWVWFAGVMLLVVGIFNGIAGLTALFQDDYFAVTNSGLLIWNYTAWGWIHLAVGVLMFLTGLAILAGQTWGRVLGVIFAGLNMIAHLGFLSAYPIWSTVIIAIDVFVIYALIVHGDEARRSDNMMR